jgi:arylformamidase
MLHSNWIDVSLPVNDTLLTWPTDPEYRIYKFASFERGNPCDASEVSMSVHTGTHIDAPAHFIKGGTTIEGWKPEITIGKCRVVMIENEYEITEEEVREKKIQMGERIIFKTHNSDSNWWEKPFNPKFINVSPGAASYLAEVKPLCIGIDYLSVGGPETGVLTHQYLLGANIWLVESLNLTKIKPGEYEMIFMPVNLTGSDGAPGRALLRQF